MIASMLSGRTRVRPLGLLLLIQLISFWPALIWYFRRMTDGSDEPYGIVALIALIAAPKMMPTPSKQIRVTNLLIPTLVCLAYVVLFPLLPPLGRAGLAALSIASTVGMMTAGTPLHFGLLGLALLSLPIIPTFQFYLGYPLRIINAAAASFVLNLAGWKVAASGTLLDWNGTPIWYDAPCSGTKMLWGGAFLHCCLSVFSGTTRTRTILIGAGVSLLTLLANICRTLLLFFPEAGLVPNPSGLHNLIGLLVFFVVGVLVLLLHRYSSPPQAEQRDPILSKQIFEHANCPRFSNQARFTLAHTAACVIPLLNFAAPPVNSGSIHFTGWPQSIDGQLLTEVPLGERESGFAADFPGRIGRFTSSHGEILLRHVTQPTRKLHPAADCLKGSGYQVLPTGAVAKQAVPGGTTSPYGCVIAIRASEKLRVCERIIDQNGKTFGDVSEWYWSTVLGRTTGPWLAVTTAERL